MPEIAYQSAEQLTRDEIDGQLRRAGWCVQSRRELEGNAAREVAVRECPTEVGRMADALCVDADPCSDSQAGAEPDAQRRRLGRI